MDGKKLIKILKQHGWHIRRIKGSHHILSKDGCRNVPIPVHGSRDLKPSLLKEILKQTKLTEDDLK